MSLVELDSPETTERTLPRRDRPSMSTGTVLRSSSASLVPPRYLPILPLQSGGMANIDLAVGSESGNYKKLVVQKSIREEFTSDSSLVAMFLDEARLCAKLNHQNLVQVYEVLEVPRPCLVMEYIEGLSFARLHQLLHSEFTCDLQLRILSHVLAGLHYAHELCDFDGAPLGIVHRDVSPQNIVITSDGRVKVLDFGIAKTASSPSYTLAGTVKGKLSYMSPEQLAGEALDRRTDIFAVGCMLWRAASGKKLWSKTGTEEIMSCLVSGRIPLPSTHRPVAPKLEAMVMRALSPSREGRHATADELRRELDAYLAETAPVCDLREWMQT
ncbi:MAG TPA: serine/threonine-protein kinase, partial [Polyangiaceae bacterium]